MPIRSYKHGSQKGTFVGKPNAIHIHIVSDNTHVQVGNKRHNFDEGDDAQTRAARTFLEQNGRPNVPGYADCHEWLGYPSNRRR